MRELRLAFAALLLSASLASAQTNMAPLGPNGGAGGSSLSLGTGVATALGNATNASGGVPTTSGLGSWTPTITASVTAGTPAYAVQVGSYEQIGHTVTAWFDIQLSGWTGSPSGNISITGLPVTSTATANDYGDCTINSFSASATFGWMTARIAPSGTAALIFFIPQTGATSTGSFTAANAGTTPSLIGKCTYHN